MSDDSTYKPIVLPLFSGKDKDYSVFWLRFHAYAVLKGFDAELDSTTSNLPVGPTVLNRGPYVKKEQEKAIRINNLAIVSFTMAFTTGVLMEHVEKTKINNEYPGGKAHAIVDRLKHKFRPTNCIPGVEAKKEELMKLKMDAAQRDPDEYFDKLEMLKNKYHSNSKTFDDEKKIAATLAKAPKKYGSVLTSMICEKGNLLTLDYMQEALKDCWCVRNNLVHVSNDKDDALDSEDEEKEYALNATSNIVCYKCS